MEEKLIVANWKENLTADEAAQWLEKFRFAASRLMVGQFDNVVICPSFVVLPFLSREASRLPGLRLGAQDVSKFGGGEFTGEVSASQLSDFVSFVIVGHSERRGNFGETDEDVNQKIGQCLKYDLTPIVCVSNLEQVSKCRGAKVSKKTIFAYEPLFAVGSGNADTPKNAVRAAEGIKKEFGHNCKVIYGGSVDELNAASFLKEGNISGVLIGRASLDPEIFAAIVLSAGRG